MKSKFLVLLILAVATNIAAQRNNHFAKLNNTVYAIENLYVDTLNSSKLIESAIVALLQKLDPHSDYLTEKETKDLNEPLQGNFDGIGIQFNMLKDTLLVIQTIVGGPSEKVGVMAGDRIVSVNDTVVAGVHMSSSDIVKRLRGKKGTTVVVKIKRRGVDEFIVFKIVRDKIPIYSLDAAYLIDSKIGYIKLNRFSSTSYNEFLAALTNLKSQGMK
ncbi:MAG: PDZ domain-containing protein, partial [Bacteroidales bacterium]|nr:PDZ domain-containing protein [Bacteroidales bacterium]